MIAWILGLLVVLKVSSCANIVDLLLDQTIQKKISANDAKTLCYSPSLLSGIGPHTLFQDTVISISSQQPLPWYSVRGVSTDDVHSNLERWIYGLFAPDITLLSQNPHEKASFLRDVLSSCPNPLFNKNRSVCNMRFSSLDTSCVTVSLPFSTVISITVTRYINPQYFVNFAAGIVFFMLAHPFSKSKVFQYSMTSALFILAGVVLLVSYLFHRFVKAKTPSYSLLELGFMGTMICTYFATGIFFVRTHFQAIILQYWEVVLGYLLSSSLLGLICTSFIRKHEESKHFIIVCVKWGIRFAGAICIYNSFASPLASLVSVGVMFLVYVGYALNKWVLARFRQKKEKPQ
eukprot:gene28110-33942_t